MYALIFAAALVVALALAVGLTVVRSAAAFGVSTFRYVAAVVATNRVIAGLERGAVTLFQPEIWAAELLRNLQKDTVFSNPQIVNRNYEGEIRDKGDTVRITNIGAITVGNYTGVGSVTFEELTDAQQSLLIDQSKFFAFEIDDVDARQSAGDLLTEANEEAGYALRDTMDQFVASLYTGVAAGNNLGTVAVTTPDLADAQLLALSQKLNESNVPQEGRYIVVTPWYESLLLDSPKFIDASQSGDGGDAFRNGRIGRARGFDIFRSNNCVNVTGDDWAIQAGHRMALTFAEQIVQTEALRPEASFSDAVKGLHVYGGKVVRPTALAVVIASET